MTDKPLRINGKEYALPEPGTMTMGEARIIERYCDGHSVDDGYSLAKMCGLIHIAIARAEPRATYVEIGEIVDRLGLDEINAQLPSEDDADPPTGSRSDDNASLSDSSGPVSEPTPENEIQNGTGAQDSDTGFRSFHATSHT